MPKLVSAEELREYREAQDERAAWEAEKDRIQEQFKQKYAIPHQQVTDVIDKGKLSLIQKGRERWRKALVANEFAKDMLTGRLGPEEITMELLSYIDILVDGEFVLELKNPKLRFRGSENQRIIKVKESLASDNLVLWDDTEGL